MSPNKENEGSPIKKVKVIKQEFSAFCKKPLTNMNGAEKRRRSKADRQQKSLTRK